MRSMLSDLGSVIYYLRVGDFIKIGHTEDLGRRLGEYPADAKLLAWQTDRTRQHELELHRSLAQHIAKGREWYHPTTEVLAVVRQARIDCGLERMFRSA